MDKQILLGFQQKADFDLQFSINTELFHGDILLSASGVKNNLHGWRLQSILAGSRKSYVRNLVAANMCISSCKVKELPKGCYKHY